jgi:ThiF family protein
LDSRSRVGSEVITDQASWTLTMTTADHRRLYCHLFQRGWREHASFLFAGVTESRRLLVRRVEPIADEQFIARVGDYEISPAAVARAVSRALREGLCLIWAHSHPGSGETVAFSPQDLATIARAHKSLVDISQSHVGALVFGEDAVAGLVTGPDGAELPLSRIRILGPRIRDQYAAGFGPASADLDERHARQILVFGNSGQQILRQSRVAVLGAGGGGSLIIQQLAHLDVGDITAFDYDVVAKSNLSRIIGATQWDAILRRRKVKVAKRVVKRINRSVILTGRVQDAADREVARQLGEMDAIFVATDTALGRHAANAVAFQYMVPVFVVGAKVQAAGDGTLSSIHTIVRPAIPGFACLHCQCAIPAYQLHAEQLGEDERHAQDYLGGGEDIVDPSVISLNGIAASSAVTDFLMMFCSLFPEETDLSPTVWYPLERRAARRPTIRQPECGWCDPDSPSSAFARGDTWPLPLPNRPKKTWYSAWMLKVSWLRHHRYLWRR